MTQQQAEKNKLKTVKYEDFQKYHKSVMATIENIMDIIRQEFGDYSGNTNLKEHQTEARISRVNTTRPRSRRKSHITLNLNKSVTILDKFELSSVAADDSEWSGIACREHLLYYENCKDCREATDQKGDQDILK